MNILGKGLLRTPFQVHKVQQMINIHLIARCSNLNILSIYKVQHLYILLICFSCSRIFTMNNETIKLIETRRSVRAFAPHAIEPELLDKLKRLTLRAPSGGNMTVYSIIEVTDPEIKAKLAKICDNQLMIAKAPGVWVFLADMERWYSWIKDGGSEERIGKSVRKPGIGDFHLAMQDAVIASQNAATAAEALGLGSCFIGDIIENYEELQKLLNLPQYAAPASMLIFGYPKEEPKGKQTRRPEPEYIFMENGYHKQSVAECAEMYKLHEEDYRERKILPNNNTGTYADYYFNKKYSSDFMKEMNRSTEVFLRRWCEDKE